MKLKSFQGLHAPGSRPTKRNKRQKVLPKLLIPTHELNMILIDLSKILHEGREKTNDKKKAVVTNEKVAIILVSPQLTLTFIHLSQVGVNFLAYLGKPNGGK